MKLEKMEPNIATEFLCYLRIIIIISITSWNKLTAIFETRHHQSFSVFWRTLKYSCSYHWKDARVFLRILLFVYIELFLAKYEYIKFLSHPPLRLLMFSCSLSKSSIINDIYLDYCLCSFVWWLESLNDWFLFTIKRTLLGRWICC